jgi:cyclic pyranopterin phosphate synthase
VIDPFGRKITYLRLSVTDRCDLRCTYCMPLAMKFLPRQELLSIDELETLCIAFIAKGIRKLRLTGGEPLVRKGLLDLIERLSPALANGGLDELTLTTNGSRLAHFADDLARFGVRRVNVSLDTLRADTFARITRGGRLADTLTGIGAALAAGLEVKINTVALRDDNLDELPELVEWAHARGMPLTLIEVMPMGDVEARRIEQHVPLTEVRRRLGEGWELTDLAMSSGGPARYVRTDAGGTIGFITPLSHNFCGSCNRVRVTCTGQLYMCLGHAAKADLRAALRSGGEPALGAAIDEAILMKPKSHDFAIAHSGVRGIARHMSVTGG